MSLKNGVGNFYCAWRSDGKVVWSKVKAHQNPSTLLKTWKIWSLRIPINAIKLGAVLVYYFILAID